MSERDDNITVNASYLWSSFQCDQENSLGGSEMNHCVERAHGAIRRLFQTWRCRGALILLDQDFVLLYRTDLMDVRIL